MQEMLKQFRDKLEQFSNYHIERVGKRSVAFLNKKEPDSTWTSNRSQLKLLIETHNINVILDVGANIGLFAKRIRRFYSGEIHSFEPVSAVYDTLSKTAQPDPKWHTHNYALGSSNDETEINITNDSQLSSILAPNEFNKSFFQHNGLTKGKELISVKRLDSIFDEIARTIENPRVLLKIDTQGFDQEVFKGIGEKLQHIHIIQSEVSLIPIYENMPHWTDSIGVFERAGFGVTGLFPVAFNNNRVLEYDCLMTRAD